MKYYTFKVEIGGYGDTPEDAWDDAVAGFILDPGVYDDVEFSIQAE